MGWAYIIIVFLVVETATGNNWHLRGVITAAAVTVLVVYSIIG